MADTVTKEEIDALANSIGHNYNLPQLCLKLGFKLADFDRYDCMNTGGGLVTEKGTRQLLRDWRAKTHDNQRAILIKCLWDSDLGGLAEKHIEEGNTSVTDEEIRALADDIGTNPKLIKFGYGLDFNDPKMQRYQQMNMGGGKYSVDGTRQLFIDWKNKNPRNQRPTLIAALKESNLGGLAEEHLQSSSSQGEQASESKGKSVKRKQNETPSSSVTDHVEQQKPKKTKNSSANNQDQEVPNEDLAQPDILDENDDFLDEKSVFKLHVKEPKSVVEQQFKEQKRYLITASEKKDLILIVNNFQDECGSTKVRKGSQVDVDNVERVFCQLGYIARVVQNTDILKTLKDFKDSVDKEEFSSVVVFIMTHGNETCVQNQDGSIVQRSEIRKVLTEMTTMRGKPKILFYQTCRGGAIPGVVAADLIQSQVESDEITLTDNADIFEASATADGYKAFRSTKKGSWFVHYLCKELYDNVHLYDLETMMEHVTDVLSQKEYINANKEKKCQTPSVTKTTRKKIYFLTQ